MKTLRIIATVVVGGYLLAMGLQLIGVSIAIVRDVGGIAPDTANARGAFLPNLLVCCVCTVALWMMWRKRPGVPTRAQSPQGT